jgi:hypothetical protein
MLTGHEAYCPPPSKKAHLGLVASLVVVIADVKGLVKVLDEVNEEPQGEPALLNRT